MDHNTRQLDDNNPKSDATPGGGSDTGQETAHEAISQALARESAHGAKAAPQEPVSSMSAEERKAALEAIIYAADEPATIEQLAKALGEPKADVQIALDELVASYASDTRGIEVRGVAGGYKMYTKPQHHDLVRRFIKSLRPPLRLTMPALETLAVISYKQPVTAPEIQEIRGVNTSGVIKTLLDKKLITTAGRKEVIGRPILYRTSKEFLMRFGLSDLGELPSLKEFEALAREALGTDEGVAEGETGDESVLDSMEPTEAEAAAELEAAASESATERAALEGEPLAAIAQAPSASGPETTAPKQFEQSISADVIEAVAALPTKDASTPERESEPAEASAEERHAAKSLECAQSESHQADAVAPADETTNTPTESPASAAEPVEAVAESHHAPESHELAEIAQPSPEPEPVPTESESADQHFSESAHAAAISMETPESSESATEYEPSAETEQEISDEILAQLTQGIEVEVSADSLAELSATGVPAEESPTQFYSSDAEPERQPFSSAEAPEHASDHESSQNSESDSEPEKSRKAAAGE